MHEPIMRRIFLSLVLANILLAISAGLKRDMVATTHEAGADRETAGGHADAGFLVLVGEPAHDPGESMARSSLGGHSDAVGTPPVSSYGVDEHSATPEQIVEREVPAIALDSAPSSVASTVPAPDGREANADVGTSARVVSPGSGVETGGDSVELPSLETAEAAPTHGDAAGAGKDANNSATAADGSLSCVLIGPFAHKPDVVRLFAGLDEPVSVGDAYEQEVADKPIFWVHVPPLNDTREARRAQEDLSGRGIESFVISDLGPLHNGISLGVFRDPDSAQRLAKARTSIGYPVAIHESQRKRTVHFVRVRVPAVDAERLVAILAGRAGTAFGEATAAVVDCDEGFKASVAGAQGRG